jgi:pimeloyl-ACP methyl ester carboxylesterase
VNSPDLPPALDAPRRTLRGRAGAINVYVAGSGAPLLLVHSLNAAASAYEVKPIFEQMVAEREVWALDLPGFGFSDRSERHYDINLYVDAIATVVDAIAAPRPRTSLNDPAPPIDALALSLAGELLARLALREPQRLRTITLVNPTGFDARAARRAHLPAATDGPQPFDPHSVETLEVAGLHAAVSWRGWAAGLFSALTCRPSIRFFLRGAFGRREIDEGLVDYAWRTAHQPGAHFAPFAFVAGRLFTRNASALMQALRLPVWMPRGTRGDFRDFSAADWARAAPNWTVQAFPTGAFPHFEDPQTFNDSLRRFLQCKL